MKQLYTSFASQRAMRAGRLEGSRAIITGSSRGIGRSIALEFANEGASVLINCDKRVEEGEEVVQTIESRGGTAALCVADVKSYSDCMKIVDQAVANMGGVDVLVNNAGITRDALLTNVDGDVWDEVISVNLKGVMNCTKAVVQLMKEQESGRIINISSVVGVMGNVGQTSYSASKAGVIGMTKTLARELARYGILVNAIAPGFCMTEMVSSIPEDVKEKILRQIPLKRFGLPDEIARVATFLASDDSTYMTGQLIGVNGGLYM